ncbi:MAG TPA: hypothetical protein PL078_03235 [Bacillota bacterium]|jgi:hypothetical protein|nr:hypothetical protein [Peptococcaceae bacterium MAG4]NLW38332.1 hypothetical protein [Peptococcaceae bacterium]HPU36249.1 hypothetical protein [Bacillota bacterium]HPZ42997.1 hypothetical protein [Bacillota bacterium]HQD75385.1 hypothetical protein [Bacillota bacterium]
MISGKRIIVFALLQVFCLLAAPPGKQASSEGEAPGATNPEERLEALARQAELARREGELAAELLDWDVKTESARQEQAQLLLEIQQAEFSLAGAEAGLEESRSRLDEGLEDLGWWVNYLYRYGHGSFLEVILGAKSFSEFIERAGLVFTIISAQAELVEEVRERAARLEAQLEALRQARALLDQKNAALARRIQDMDHHKAGREAFLKELREQSASLAEEIIKKETLLFRSLDSLQYLLQHLDSLPWHSLTPDTFSLAGKRMRLEFKDQEVNRVFFGQGDPALAGLSVHCTPGLFSISGTAAAGAAGVDFKIEGNFELRGKGRVAFQPSQMYLSGVPVSSKVLGFIAGEELLEIDFGSFLHGYSLSGIRPEEGRLVVYITG